ncbi:MAG: hypothetical protein C4293_21820, partial [Nitrospiraceae bacterium]
SLTASVVSVNFTPRLLAFEGAREGDLLTGPGGGGSVSAQGDPSTGKIELHLHREGAPASGQGTLLSLRFKARAPGISLVEIPEVTLAGARAGSRAVTGRGVVKVQ